MTEPERRSVTFMLSPRVVDLDSYLPVAMEMKAQRPNWDIRFVAFDAANIETIRRNPSLRAGLERCATLVDASSSGKSGLSRLVNRVATFLRLAGPILRRRDPVLINSRPYAVFPYDLLAFMAHLRGGLAVTMCKNRSPDAVHELMFTFRDLPPQQHGSRFARLVSRRDADLLVHYHDDQAGLMAEVERFGRTEGVPRQVIGMPHYLPEWRSWIAREVERERNALREDGVLRDGGQVLGVFAAKPGSGQNLGLPGAVERSFDALIPVLQELAPNATILVRAHPKAVGAAYIQKWIDNGDGRIKLTFMHPEVLIALSDRVFANNPTNVLFHGFGGRLIDVSEYPDEHIQKHGSVSLAHGLGPLYADPRDPSFKQRIARLLKEDAMFDTGGHDGRMRAILARNPADIAPLLARLDRAERTVPAQQPAPYPSE